MSLTEKTVGFLGVDNLRVVDTPEALLICDPEKAVKMRELVSRVQEVNPQVTEYHSWDLRPWGRYETLLHTDTEVVKKIWVDPGAKISYQSHDFREEHWVIVQGKGEVVLNDEVRPVQEGLTSTFPREPNTALSTPVTRYCVLLRFNGGLGLWSRTYTAIRTILAVSASTTSLSALNLSGAPARPLSTSTT